jgi:RNA polymerase sigma-70 factor (ECF subfamily)
MTPETTRPSLLSRVRDVSDDAAWREFDERYRELIFRYCRRCELSAADAEDIRQIVMVRLMRILPGFRYDPARGRFHDYLYRVTRTAIADFRDCPDARNRAVLADGLAEERAAAKDVEVDPAWEQEWQALAAVRQTSDERSVAVFERLLAGTSIEQAAKEFEMSTDAVHKVKQRMRDRVQHTIAQQVREEDALDG